MHVESWRQEVIPPGLREHQEMGRWGQADHNNPILNKPWCPHAWKPPSWVGGRHSPPPQPLRSTPILPPPTPQVSPSLLVSAELWASCPARPRRRCRLAEAPTVPPAGFQPQKQEQTKGTDRLHRSGAVRRALLAVERAGGGTGELRGGCVHGAEPAARPQTASHGGIHPKRGPAVSPSPTQGMAGASQDSRCPSPQPGCPLGLPRAGTRWGHCSWF